MDISNILLLLWSVLIFWVLGQIWLVQIVIYPLFGFVGEDAYINYHRAYTRRIPFPVIFPGFASFLLPIALAFAGPAVPAWMTAGNIVTGLISLAVTVGLEIPRHGRLENHGKDPVVIAELIRFNWPRTLAITAQSVITFLMLWHVIGA